MKNGIETRPNGQVIIKFGSGTGVGYRIQNNDCRPFHYLKDARSHADKLPSVNHGGK